jgi:hypothetical protein
MVTDKRQTAMLRRSVASLIPSQTVTNLPMSIPGKGLSIYSSQHRNALKHQSQNLFPWQKGSLGKILDQSQLPHSAIFEKSRSKSQTQWSPCLPLKSKSQIFSAHLLTNLDTFKSGFGLVLQNGYLILWKRWNWNRRGCWRDHEFEAWVSSTGFASGKGCNGSLLGTKDQA